MKERHKVPIACYLVLIEDDNILLWKRQNTGYADGMYWLVSGHKEENESVSASMIREAREEAGIILESKDIEIGCVMSRKAGVYDYIDYFFVARKYWWTVTNMEPEKCSELKFFNINMLPEDTLDYIRIGIRTCFTSIKALEYGWEKK